MEKCITNDEVVAGLMAYMMTIVFGHLRVEALSLEINVDISIQGFRRVNEEQTFIWQ
jgi:hypothetical protein